MKKNLREYQIEARKARNESWRSGNVPVVSMDTGSGKSLNIADDFRQILKQGGKVLNLCMGSTGLVSQNYLEICEYLNAHVEKYNGSTSWHDVGIVCAEYKRFEYRKPSIVGSPGTVVNRLRHLERCNFVPDVILIDECDLLSPNPESDPQKILRFFRRRNPKLLLCGYTATPYRGDMCITSEHKKYGKATFNVVCYQTDTKALIAAGWLCDVVCVNTVNSPTIDMTGVKVIGKDFDKKLMGVRFEAIYEAVVADSLMHIEHHKPKYVLLFASTISNAELILKTINETNHDIEIKILHSKVQNKKEILEWFNIPSKKTKIIINVDMLTVGYNKPDIDFIIFARAIKSRRLFEQAKGRGFRPHGSKDFTKCADYGTNFERHDDSIAPKTKKRAGEVPQKFCKVDSGGCGALNLAAAKQCKECGAEFISEDERGNYSMRSRAAALALTVQRFDIVRVDFSEQQSKKSGIDMIKIEFYDEISLMVEGGYVKPLYSAFMCLDHGGQAANIARSMLKSMMIEPKQYYTLKNEELSVESILFLLQNHYDDFFKKITKIAVWDNAKNPKYKDFKILEYGE